MKGYTIQNSIDLLEKNGGGSGGAASADDVSFDNTDTVLNAANVQNAIVELSNVNNISTNETVIGKWDDEILYSKLVECGELPSNTTKTIDPQITNLKDVKNIIPIIGHVADSTYCEFAGKIGRFSARSTGITIVTTESWEGYTCNMVLWYTKNAVTTKTRKKK